MQPTPFRLQIADADIADLHDRLRRTRLPDQAPDAPWAYGTDVGYLRELIEYWRTGFDWRAQEAALNTFPQFRAPVAGIDLHFLQVPGIGPAPKPLLLLHGWPGSVFEFLDMIPRLTDPARFGGDPEDAFTVIVPSLPGYGLSFAPGQKRFSIPDIADAMAELMTTLGHTRFGVQGGDWGAAISIQLALKYPQRLTGLHLNFLPIGRDPAALNADDPDEARYRTELAHFMAEETGYQAIQGTRPQTLAFGLTDSPAGLAAWIAEKFRAWSDCNGDIHSAIDRDRMLADISLYWFTGAIGSAFWPYYARLHGPALISPGAHIAVPMGHARFPTEITRPPRSVAARVFTDIRRWTEMPHGGHFAAMEQPEALGTEIAAFFRAL
jgi:pimeloyl-ACP methyl ester carboxylesterase